jgi:MFS-type transporter involved in bile tolerance (Atg22 family)
MVLNARWGIKKVMLLGNVALIPAYPLLNYISSGIPYFLVAALFGLSVGLYYSAFHIDFAKFCDKKKEATEFSILIVVARIAFAAGPVVGAIVISKLSYTFLFFMVSAILLISFIPLSLTKDKKVKKPDFSFKKLFNADSKKKALAYQALSITETTGAIFWPVFIFWALGEVISLGAIESITSILLVVLLLIVGKMADKHRNRVLKLGITCNAVSWPLRLFFLSPIGIFLVNIFAAASHVLTMLPLSKVVYNGARESKNMANYFLFREFNLWFGRVIMFGLVIITGSIFWVFILAFFATFLLVPVLDQK